CLDHDPRHLFELLRKGEKLAFERKAVFADIIRGDPETALKLAVPREQLQRLPYNIKQHLESWESGFVDIRSMHLCFTKERPSGYIKTTAQFPDGRNFRTWSYGKRSKLHHKNGLAIWGISLGKDLAISEKPVRVINNTNSTGIIEFAGSSISFTSEAERDLVVHQIREAEFNYRGRRGAIHQIKYPVALASSMSADSILKAKYDLNTTKVTFNEALSSAMSKNGSLLQIKDSTENLLILEWLKEQNEEGILFPGRDESNNSVNYVWLGATDNNATMGTIYDEETNTTSQQLEINADEGNWKWLNGEEFSYANWAWDTSNNATKDFVAIDWNDTNGSWVDINETARLPFVIEYDLEIAKIETDLKGIRKVLVVPARFVDETVYYQSAFGGSNVLLTNELGEEIMDQIKADPYEPATKATIQKAMDEVAEFFNRNTDGELKIIPVITPVVTLPHMNGQIRRYIPIEGTSDPNVYDSEGNFSALEEVVIQELPEDPDKPSIEVLAMSAAATASEDWDYEGFAFIGLSSIEIDGISIDTNFSEPPSVALVGGEA
ncbi:MAG: C-type lectin domain-containing protein, partial [Gammaproteobacteria bacterium]|nr:C-type lectin domain-containing protein [Gammaproteobacteria bacterium]